MKSNLQRACGLLFCNFYQLNRNIKLLILPLAFIVSSVSAQDIIFNVKTYKGGYNVSCNGSADGNIDAIVVGGIPPYTYSWNNGATTQDLINIGAGAYTLTVTDALNNSKSKSVTLFEADIIDVFLFSTLYEGGYHISKMGASDGAITTDVKGGAPPYSYLWNNGSKKANLSGLTAGTYSVTITDQNGCAVTKSITLLEPTPITINISATTYGSYNTSCFKSTDGNINVTVSGGMPPYKFNWSNGSFDEDLTNVPADEYKLLVYDANKATAEAQITLTQPNPLELVLTPSVYPNDYNISCNGCFNGSITSQITGGTMPATYLWKGKGVNGQTTANLSNLGPGDYALMITDANGCKTEAQSYLFEPPVNGWNRTGNSLDNSDFLGSTNNVPLVLKTANTEQLRISETGNVGIGTNNPQNKLDVNGNSNINGNLKLSGNLTFADTKVLGYLPATGGAPEIFSLGTLPNLNLRSVTSCSNAFTNVPSTYQFNGSTQHWGNSAFGGDINILETGFDGANGIIEMYGSNTIGGPRLLMNYYCGKDIFMCTGSNGGNISMTSANGKVGIGTDAPAAKLDVRGDVKISSLAGTGNNVVQVDNDGKLSIMPFAAAGVGFWQTTNGSDIFHQNGNVGIGTNLPSSKLEVSGGSITISNPPNIWTDANWLVAIEAPSGSIWKTKPYSNRSVGFGMTDDASSAGWYWVYPSTDAAGVDHAIYPMKLNVDYTTFTTTLAVNGNIRAKDIVVTLTGWPDFVFEDSYKRMNIMEKEAYYKREKHLPYMSKGEDVIENGLQVGQNMNGMMQNIEENTLDIADLYKRILLLEKENSYLKESLKSLNTKK